MVLSELQTAVKFILDEVTPSGVSHPIDNYMDEAVKSSLREIVLTAPKYLLPIVSQDYPESGESAIVEDNNAYIPIPINFRRLYRIKFSTWGRHVEDYISQGNPDYIKYQNKYLKPGRVKPVVAYVKKMLGDDTEPKDYFECFSTGEASEFENTEFLYIAENQDLSEYKNSLLKPSAHLVAYHILIALEEYNLAKATYQEYLKVLTSVSK
jgi:hypothetical protein